MRKVTKAEFFAVMNKLDVTPSVQGRYTDDNYRSDWKTRDGRIVGVSKPCGDTPHYKPNRAYFLA